MGSRAEPAFETPEMQERVWGRVWGVANDVGRLRMCALHTPGEEMAIIDPDKYDDSIEALIGLTRALEAAGDLWIYATSIVHASERARKPGRRRVLQVDYASGELPGGLQWLGVTGGM